jgi:hypothetical protein
MGPLMDLFILLKRKLIDDDNFRQLVGNIIIPKLVIAYNGIFNKQ